MYRRRLRENAVFMLYIDGFFPERKSMKAVDLLGEQVLLSAGIMSIIYETGSPVHIAYSVRDNHDWRRAKVTVSARLTMSGNPDDDFQTIVRAHEAAVLKHPEQWWGWINYERGTVEYYEKYRRRMEQGGDRSEGQSH